MIHLDDFPGHINIDDDFFFGPVTSMYQHSKAF